MMEQARSIQVPMPGCVTGRGQSDTHALTLSDGRQNPHPSAGQPYQAVTLDEVLTLMENPPSSEKALARWLLPSDYLAHDARNHQAQRANGSFWWLCLDVDKNNLNLEDVQEALSRVLGSCLKLIYSTASATEDNRKWRALVPLAAPISGADYSDTASAFFDMLEDASAGVLIPDRPLQYAGQIIYLPNKRTDFYQYQIEGSDLAVLTNEHRVVVRREEVRRQQAAADNEAAQARMAKAARRLAAPPSVGESPVDAFNSRHTVADLLERYGYARAGHSRDWRSPYQSSGSYATRDCGDYWISLSGSDADAGIGTATRNGHRHGDAFDLFCHFEHGGVFNAAVRAYADEVGLSGNQSGAIILNLPAKATDNVTALPPAPVPDEGYFTAAELDGQPVPPREWHVPDLVPARTVTTINGDGGTGKSLAALQLAVATALGRRWLGQEVTAGSALFISAEDDRPEIHRRLADVSRAEGVRLADMPNLTLRSLAGEDALLAVPKGSGGDVLTETPLFRAIDGWISHHRPTLTILDTLADLFGGNELIRTQSRQFIGMLRGLALRHDTTVVLLAHPSQAGISSGTGSSGSTAWSNSVRSRLYLRRVKSSDGDESDPEVRELEVMKANYGKTGLVLPLRWTSGVFVLDTQNESTLDRRAVNAKSERVFLKLLRNFTEDGRFVSASPGPTFAPANFALHPGAEGCTKRALRAAMDNLFAARKIEVATHGTGAKARSHIALVQRHAE